MMKFIFLLAFVTVAQSLSSEEIDDITSKIDSGKSLSTNHIILRSFVDLYLKKNCILGQFLKFHSTKVKKNS